MSASPSSWYPQRLRRRAGSFKGFSQRLVSPS